MTSKWIPICGATFLICGCGGGGGSGSGTSEPPPTPIPTNASGIWEGAAMTSGVTIGFTGVITEEKEGRFVDENGTQYVIDSLVGNDGNIAVNFTAFANVGFTFVDGSTVATGNMSGTVNEHDTFDLAGGTTRKIPASWC